MDYILADFRERIDRSFQDMRNEKNKRGSDLNLRVMIKWLLDNFEEYFAVNISSTVNLGKEDMSRIEKFGVVQKETVEVFEETGVFLYVIDLKTNVYAPKAVKNVLGDLIYKYKHKAIALELAKQIKKKLV